MRVLVVSNRGDGDEGYVGERLRFHRSEFLRIERENPSALVNAERDCDMLLLLGSSWSVYDESHHVSVRAEQELVIRAQLAHIPILGICFGGQLISGALGLQVRPAEVPEIGWRTVRSTGQDSGFSGPWFQYHFDRWTEGGDVATLAVSEGGPQAYWHGATLALQFHPEVTPATILRWCEEGRDELLQVNEDVDQIMRDTDRLSANAKQRCFDLVDRFLERASGARDWARMLST